MRDDVRIVVIRLDGSREERGYRDALAQVPPPGWVKDGDELFEIETRGPETGWLHRFLGRSDRNVLVAIPTDEPGAEVLRPIVPDRPFRAVPTAAEELLLSVLPGDGSKPAGEWPAPPEADWLWPFYTPCCERDLLFIWIRHAREAKPPLGASARGALSSALLQDNRVETILAWLKEDRAKIDQRQWGAYLRQWAHSEWRPWLKTRTRKEISEIPGIASNWADGGSMDLQPRSSGSFSHDAVPGYFESVNPRPWEFFFDTRESRLKGEGVARLPSGHIVRARFNRDDLADEIFGFSGKSFPPGQQWLMPLLQRMRWAATCRRELWDNLANPQGFTLPLGGGQVGRAEYARLFGWRLEPAEVLEDTKRMLSWKRQPWSGLSLPRYVDERAVIAILLDRYGALGGGGKKGTVTEMRIAELLAEPKELAKKIERHGELVLKRAMDSDKKKDDEAKAHACYPDRDTAEEVVEATRMLALWVKLAAKGEPCSWPDFASNMGAKYLNEDPVSRLLQDEQALAKASGKKLSWTARFTIWKFGEGREPVSAPNLAQCLAAWHRGWPGPWYPGFQYPEFWYLSTDTDCIEAELSHREPEEEARSWDTRLPYSLHETEHTAELKCDTDSIVSTAQPGVTKLAADEFIALADRLLGVTGIPRCRARRTGRIELPDGQIFQRDPALKPRDERPPCPVSLCNKVVIKDPAGYTRRTYHVPAMQELFGTRRFNALDEDRYFIFGHPLRATQLFDQCHEAIWQRVNGGGKRFAPAEDKPLELEPSTEQNADDAEPADADGGVDERPARNPEDCAHLQRNVGRQFHAVRDDSTKRRDKSEDASVYRPVRTLTRRQIDMWRLAGRWTDPRNNGRPMQPRIQPKEAAESLRSILVEGAWRRWPDKEASERFEPYRLRSDHEPQSPSYSKGGPGTPDTTLHRIRLTVTGYWRGDYWVRQHPTSSGLRRFAPVPGEH